MGPAADPGDTSGADAALPRPIDVLPHRPPFLFVDRLTALDPGVGASGSWRLTGDEVVGLLGHAPGHLAPARLDQRLGLLT